MADILCVTNGLPGLLYSSLELARRLEVAGHRVVYASYPETRSVVEDHGLEFLELAPGRYDEFLESDATAGALRRVLTLEQRRRRAVASLAVDGFVASVRAVTPDLMLIDGELREHIVAASVTGVRTAMLNTFASIWRQPGLPPPHRSVRPGVGWAGSRIGTWLLWRELRFKKWRRAWRHRITRVGCDQLSVLRALARANGFDLRRETDRSQWPIPFTFSRLPVLSLHALEFEFLTHAPEGVQYVGPMVSEHRIDPRTTPELRAAFERVVARCRDAEPRRTLVYAGFGSFFSSDVGFLRRLIDGVVSDGRELIISLGGRHDPATLGPLPEGVHVFSWVPQVEVLRHADVAVVHGGANTVDECVLAGVPMLVYCGYETDMGGNSARVVHHGLGIAGDRRRDDPVTISGHVERLLTEPRFSRTVNRFREHYAAYAERRVAERAVEGLLQGPEGPAS